MDLAIHRGPDNQGNYEFHWQNDNFEAHFLSDVGIRRPANEDACIMCVPEESDLRARKGILFAVADGMGGAAAGEFASRLALTTLTQQYYAQLGDSVPRNLSIAIASANKAVFEEAESNVAYQGMGTTVSALVLRDNCAYLAQVGDSRVYLLRDKSYHQLTADHSFVAEQLREGVLSEDEARGHPMRNLITRAIGARSEVEPDIYSLYIEKSDTLLLCSDGLCNGVSPADMQAALSNSRLQGAARMLVGQALDAGGDDNITTVLVRVLGEPGRQMVDSGAEHIALPKPGLRQRLRRLFR